MIARPCADRPNGRARRSELGSVRGLVFLLIGLAVAVAVVIVLVVSSGFRPLRAPEQGSGGVNPHLIRFVDFGGSWNVLLRSAEEERVARRWDFTDGATGGWEPHDADAEVRLDAEGLLVRVEPRSVGRGPNDTKLPPLISCPVSFEARDVDVLTIRLVLPASKYTPRVYWMREGESDFEPLRHVAFPVPIGQGRMREARVVLGDHPEWSGRISRLGLFLSNLPVEVAIERIDVSRIGLTGRLLMGHPGGELTKARIGDELREVLLVPPGEHRDFEVDVGREARLEVALGRIGAAAGGGGTDARLVVEVVAEGEGGAVGPIVQTVTGREEHWLERTMDLGALAGRRARVRFAVEGSLEAGDWLGAFGAPVISAPAPVAATAGPATTPAPNVILISLDTLRGDHVGLAGYHRNTTPHLDRLAAEGAVFTNALAPAPYTLASHISLMTALWPSAHGVVGNSQRLVEGIPMLAESLRDAGYRTAAVVEDGYVAAHFGYHRGFERYDDGAPGTERLPERAALTFARAEAELSRLCDQRFFLFVHTYACHTPYNAPEPWISTYLDPDYAGSIHPGFSQVEAMRVVSESSSTLRAEDLARIIALYDGGIRAADAALGSFLERLAALSLDRDTLIVVLSDHGEEFLDHGIAVAMHGYSLYQELLHVPLVMRWPGGIAAGAVVESAVSLVDVAPTLLDLLHVRPMVSQVLGSAVQGVSLVPLLHGRSLPSRPLFAQELRFTNQTAVIFDETKLIRRDPLEEAMRDFARRNFPQALAVFEARGAVELFDLATDPGETRNLQDTRTEERARLAELLDRMLAEAAAFRDSVDAGDGLIPGLDDALRQRIEALGYAGGRR